MFVCALGPYKTHVVQSTHSDSSMVRNSLRHACWLFRLLWCIDRLTLIWHPTLPSLHIIPIDSTVNVWWWWCQTKCRWPPAECSTAMMRHGRTTWRIRWLLPLRPWWASMEMRTAWQLWECCMTTIRSEMIILQTKRWKSQIFYNLLTPPPHGIFNQVTFER